MGAEVPVPGIEGSRWSGGTQQHRGVLQPVAMPDRGAECAAGSCASVGEGAAEAVDLKADGRGQRTNGAEVVHEVSVLEEAALLGQPLLGQRLLRGYGGSRCKDDTEVCEVSGEAGTPPTRDRFQEIV